MIGFQAAADRRQRIGVKIADRMQQLEPRCRDEDGEVRRMIEIDLRLAVVQQQRVVDEDEVLIGVDANRSAHSRARRTELASVARIATSPPRQPNGVRRVRASVLPEEVAGGVAWSPVAASYLRTARWKRAGGDREG